MFTASGQCVTDGCTNADPTDNVTVRMSFTVQRFKVVTVLEISDCLSVQQGSITAVDGIFYCGTTIPIGDTHRWVIADFGLFRLTSAGPPPPFLIAPAIFDPAIHPNTISPANQFRTVAAAADCTGLPSATPMRWVMERGTDEGPCYFDPDFGFQEICSPGGKTSANANYQDIGSNVMPDGAIYRDVFGPT